MKVNNGTCSSLFSLPRSICFSFWCTVFICIKTLFFVIVCHVKTGRNFMVSWNNRGFGFCLFVETFWLLGLFDWFSMHLSIIFSFAFSCLQCIVALCDCFDWFTKIRQVFFLFHKWIVYLNFLILNSSNFLSVIWDLYFFNLSYQTTFEIFKFHQTIMYIFGLHLLSLLIELWSVLDWFFKN